MINNKKKVREVELFQKQIDFIYSTAHETLFSGGVRSGKTVALCWALFKEASKKGNEIILLRKTFKSLKLSTLTTLLNGTGNYPPVMLPNTYKLNKSEGIIEVNGGGKIYCMGIEDPARIGSINCGAIFIDEATELNSEEYNALLYRLSNPNGNRQMYLATNPSGPSHWLFNHFFLTNNKNKKVITVSSTENTELPKDYIDITLGDLDGAYRSRYVYGEWTNLNNAVFDNFNRNLNTTKLNPFDKYEQYMCAIDWGITHPLGLVVAGINNGCIYILEEHKQSGMLNTQWLEKITELNNKYKDLTIIYDHSAPTIYNELNNIGIKCYKADKSVGEGINRMRRRFNKKSLIINSDCIELIREIENYAYKVDTEVVIKKNDDLTDCCFVAGTKILTDKGYKNIEDIKINNNVLTNNSFNKVTNANKTRNTNIYLYNINGRFLACTKDHKIYVNGNKIKIGELCELYGRKQKKELLKKLNLKEGYTGDIFITVARTNTSPVEKTEKISFQDVYTEIFGLNIMGKYLKDLKYTTKISITRTMILIISKLLRNLSIGPYIKKSIIKSIQNLQKNKLIKTKINVENGIKVKKEKNGIVNIVRKNGKICKTKKLSVLNAVKNFLKKPLLLIEKVIDSVVPIVKPNIAYYLRLIILRLYVRYAEILTQKINMLKQEDVVPANISENITILTETYLCNAPVYNITVSKAHNYFANNILVANCRYICSFLTIDEAEYNNNKPTIYFGEDSEEGDNYEFF